MGAQGIKGDLVAAPQSDVLEPLVAGGPVAPSRESPGGGSAFAPDRFDCTANEQPLGPEFSCVASSVRFE
jgi:hypothetical protein